MDEGHLIKYAQKDSVVFEKREKMCEKNQYLYISDLTAQVTEN